LLGKTCFFQPGATFIIGLSIVTGVN